MIPHRTIALKGRDLFGSTDVSGLNTFVPMPHRYWLGSCRAALKHIVSGRVGVPAFTCHVVRDAVLKAGCTPEFIDSGVIVDAGAVEAVAHKIDTLLLPYNFGFMPNMTDILRICKRHDITLVEDCALALGSEWNGSLAGSFGSRAVWSFNISKNMGLLGGMIGSRDPLSLPTFPAYPASLQAKAAVQAIIGGAFFNPALYSLSRRLLEGELKKEYPALDYDLPSFGKRANIAGLNRYSDVLAQRRLNAGYLVEELDGVVDFVRPLKLNNSNWPSFVIMDKKRDELRKKLLHLGVDAFPWHSYGDLSGSSPLAQNAKARFLVFETLRPRWQLEKFVSAIKKVQR